jgi:hypothetical protein
VILIRLTVVDRAVAEITMQSNKHRVPHGDRVLATGHRLLAEAERQIVQHEETEPADELAVADAG